MIGRQCQYQDKDAQTMKHMSACRTANGESVRTVQRRRWKCSGLAEKKKKKQYRIKELGNTTYRISYTNKSKQEEANSSEADKEFAEILHTHTHQKIAKVTYGIKYSLNRLRHMDTMMEVQQKSRQT